LAHAPELIERIRAQTDIVALIGSQVPLRRSGRNHMGRCPFHAERTPSFSVSADKGMYYCFGCHQGGDVFAWVMQMQGLEFGDAVRHLAERAGIELDDVSPAQKALQQQLAKMGHLLEALNKALVANLWGPSGAPARRMLAERRVPAAAARAWLLGYADDGEALCRKLLADFDLATLQATGLVGEEHQPPRLMFHGRLTFPIHDLGGRLTGFGGRLLGSGPGPKYINSRESDIFHKRDQLFGLYRAQKAIRTSKRVVLVEGFMDVLGAHGAGIEQAVAALGTALTPEHGQACKRLADEAVLMLDGDAAGERAAAKGALTLLRSGLKVHIAWLPQGEDPASLVQRAGAQALLDVLAGARPAAEALMARAFDRAPPSIEGRVQAATALMPLIDAMGESLERELYVGRLADRVGVEVSTLLAHWQADKQKAQGQRTAAKGQGGHPAAGPRAASNAPRPARAGGAPPPRGPRSPQGPQGATPAPKTEPQALHEWAMVQELLLFTQLRPRFPELLEYFEVPSVQDFLKALAQQPEGDAEAVAQLLASHIQEPQLRKRLGAVRPLSAAALDSEPSLAKRTFEDILRRLKWQHIDRALKRLLHELKATEQRGESTDALLRRKRELTTRKRALSGEARGQL
jgi:DNA primase